REGGAEEVVFADVLPPEPLAGADGAADVGTAGVVLGERRNERPVLRPEDGQVRRAVGRLRRLVVALDDVRREPLHGVPVPRQPLAEADGAGLGPDRAVQPGFDKALRQADLGRYAEALVDEAPFLEEA